MKWRSGMRPPEAEAERALARVLAFLATLVIAGCATSYNYAYDPTTRVRRTQELRVGDPSTSLPRRDERPVHRRSAARAEGVHAGDG